MNNLENNENITIYEKLANLIPKIKKIENIETKKKLTFQIKKLMDEIKMLKTKYETLEPSMGSIFFQEKEQLEKNIFLFLKEMESNYNINDENDLNIHK